MAFSDVTSAVTSLVGKNAELYLAPVSTMLGTDMNAGYFRKASPHQILGFDITFDFSYAMAPPGQTTYEFVVPGDSVDYNFPFQFPKNLLAPENSEAFSLIPSESLDNTLYKDQKLPFILAVADILEKPSDPAQNILGTSESTKLPIDMSKATTQLFNQVLDNTWAIADTVPGLGEPYVLNELITLPALYGSKEEFNTEYGEAIRDLIGEGLDDLGLELPIPGGFGDNFKTLPIAIGLPMPIMQASIGLPLHTEITMRGIPVAVPLASMGTIKFGGFGGKIGISDYLGDILYQSENELRASEKEDIQYIIDAQPSVIKPKDVSKAMYYLQLQEIEVQEIDSLNVLFSQGDTTSVIEIQNRMLDAQLQLDTMPILKKQKKKKKFPIDLSLGFYMNDFILDLESTGATGVTSGVAVVDDAQAKISATNRMISLQASKTLNLPSYLAFIGGVGIYGGLGYEWSTLDLEYILANPVAYGCFINDQYTETITEANCTGTSKEWTSGVPTPIALSFTGDNKFRTLVGIRARILLMDIYADYNFGSSNAINFGLGITVR